MSEPIREQLRDTIIEQLLNLVPGLSSNIPLATNMGTLISGSVLMRFDVSEGGILGSQLDPLPYVNPAAASLVTVPRGWRYSYPIKFEDGVSYFAPRPEYSQVESDYHPLSPVGETEAAKLPLDPAPFVCTKPWHSDERYRSEVGSRYHHFAPRPSYSQDREDYR